MHTKRHSDTHIIHAHFLSLSSLTPLWCNNTYNNSNIHKFSINKMLIAFSIFTFHFSFYYRSCFAQEHLRCIFLSIHYDTLRHMSANRASLLSEVVDSDLTANSRWLVSSTNSAGMVMDFALMLVVRGRPPDSVVLIVSAEQLNGSLSR